MRLLDRYLLRELLVPLAYCLGGFLVFWIAFDLFSELDAFQSKGLRAIEIAEYYLVKSPELLSVVLPLALLLASLYSLTNHARHHEITAIRAAGVSLWRLSLPYLGVGFVMSLTLFGWCEVVLPDSNDRADRILNRHTGDAAAGQSARVFENVNLRNERDHRTWMIARFDAQANEMTNVIIDWQLPDRSRRMWIAAGRARWTNGAWHLGNVTVDVYSAAPEAAPARLQTNQIAFADFTETPQQIKSEITVSRLTSVRAAKKIRLSLQEVRDYWRWHPQVDPGVRALLETQFHGRLARPWTCLVVILIALPFGAASGRRNVFVGVASSIFIAFIYFVLLHFGLALGTGGKLPGWLAAWSPNILFSTAGAWLTCQIR